MVDLHNINRTLDQNTKIADLMHGHPGNFIQRLRGSFAPENNPSAPKIQICQLKCGCWIIADGNNRLGLLLKKNPNATISDLPSNLMSTYKYGDWDEDTMNCWNPAPKSIGKAMTLSIEKIKKTNTNTKKGKKFYVIIEKIDNNTFFALIINIAKGQSCSAKANSITETKKKLKDNIRKNLRKMDIEFDEPIQLELNEVNIGTHECSNKVSL
jgi:hypothetical protein